MMSDRKQIKFKYVIPDDYRDYHASGVWGGVTPHGEVHIHFFSERHAIPKTEIFEASQDNPHGTLIARDIGGDIVRVMQACVVVDMDTAISFRDWLINLIDKTPLFREKKGK
ncbi:MAG: hypothetical protein KBG09_07590 [Syntrophobacterales bacterium]|jgi:hypothetical protein|nr:hypothetical protein [Syntrophobacterales bacterium]